jgi:hypothetical protein
LTSDLGVAETAPRLQTALCAEALLTAINRAPDDVARVETLASAEIHPSQLGLGKSLTTAPDLLAALNGAQRQIIVAAFQRPKGEALRPELAAAIASDELVGELAPVLRSVEERAIKVITGPPRRGERWSSDDIDEAMRYLDDLRHRLRTAEPPSVEDVEVIVTWSEPGGSP